MTATAELVAERLRSVPGLLATFLEQSERLPAPLTVDDQPISVTGGGMSEGPARLLVALLQQAKLDASFVPLSEFVATDQEGSGGTLVVFSQGLAPNARFPLACVSRYRRVLLLTSVIPLASANADDVRRLAADSKAKGVEVHSLPPTEESGLLLRVVGPTVQALAAACLAGIPSSLLQAIPSRYAARLTQTPCGSLVRDGVIDRLVLVAGGRYGDACFGLRWKLLEGLLAHDPPIYDLLQVAHGPLQALWNTPHTLLILARQEAPHEAELRARLGQVLCTPRHRLLTLHATELPGLLAYFEHSALLDRLLCDALHDTEQDLVSWPGQGQDGPLYGLCPV